MVQKQTEIKNLSACKWKQELAFCPRCETFFIDDLPKGYGLRCPEPKCNRMLIREKFKLQGRTVLDDRGKFFRTL